jgi:D-glycero-D-manno-heptose 1,7-bisphosphate phosphatase
MKKLPTDPIQEAVFFDMLGILLRENSRLEDIHNLEFMPGIFPALRRLHDAGYVLVMTTDLTGATGARIDTRRFARLARYLKRTFLRYDIPVSGIYFCPHRLQDRGTAQHGACRCRKPSPALLQKAAHDLNLDLRGSWVIAGSSDDVAAGEAAGCRTVRILPRRGAEVRIPNLQAPDPEAAAAVILSASLTAQPRDHAASRGSKTASAYA